MLVRDGPQVDIVSRTNNVQVGLRVSASDLEQAAGRALTGAPRTAVDPSSPPARVTVSVTTSLLASIVEQLRKVEQPNNSRAWSLEQDVALLEQLSKSVPVSKIIVQGKTSERAAPHRISELDKQLPGIIADVRRISSANELCEAEKAYMDRSLSGAVTRALSGIDRSTPQRSSMWSLREDTLLLKKFLCDTDYCKELRIPGHDGEHAARCRLEQLRLLSSEIADAVPIRIRSHQHAKARDHNAAAFPWLLSDANKPLTSIAADTWTAVRHTPLCLPGAVLPGVEISFAHGSARIPAEVDATAKRAAVRASRTLRAWRRHASRNRPLVDIRPRRCPTNIDCR